MKKIYFFISLIFTFLFFFEINCLSKKKKIFSSILLTLVSTYGIYKIFKNLSYPNIDNIDIFKNVPQLKNISFFKKSNLNNF